MGALAVFLASGEEPPAETVRAMCEAVPHRGTRLESITRGRCALACVAREDAWDVALADTQELSASFVGVLDNLRELATELRLDDAPTPWSPAHVLAHGVAREGPGFARKLRGVFAAAVTDGERVFCFRDHIGYEPLFCRLDERGLYVGSEPKQVLAGARLAPQPDLDVVGHIVALASDKTTGCALRGVSRVPQATIASSDGRTLQHERYWEPESLLEAEPLSGAEMRERFAALMEQAVRRCLTGEDAILLSGGIDSPAVAAFGASSHIELTGRPLPALSAVYPKYPSVDERRYVELISERLGLSLHTFEQEVNPLADLERWTGLAGTPYPAAALSQYEESFQRARELGYRTLLSGEHAELVFNMNADLLGYLVSHGRAGAARDQLRSRRSRGASIPWLASLLIRSVAPARVLAYQRRRSRFSVPDWFDARDVSARRARSISGPRHRWRQQQLAAFTGPGVSLEAASVCQAVCGVRLRRPWADIDLWEFFLGLRAEQKFPNHLHKWLVRDLLRGRVPDEVLDRTDRTSFNEVHLAQIDYTVLRRYLIDPEHRLAGFDYELLAKRLRGEELEIVDYNWARNLATAHAFLVQL